MTRRISRPAGIFTLLVVALALLAPVLLARAQDGAPARPAPAGAGAAAVVAAPLPAGTGRSAPAQDRFYAYLPLVERQVVATIEFAAGVNSETLEPIGPSESFASGIDLIYVAWRLEGFQNRQYRMDFTVPDGQTLTGTTRTAMSNDLRAFEAYCITTITCDSGRRQLPAGTYTARLYIDGQLFGERRATIR